MENPNSIELRTIKFNNEIQIHTKTSSRTCNVYMCYPPLFFIFWKSMCKMQTNCCFISQYVTNVWIVICFSKNKMNLIAIAISIYIVNWQEWIEYCQLCQKCLNLQTDETRFSVLFLVVVCSCNFDEFLCVFLIATIIRTKQYNKTQMKKSIFFDKHF